MLTFCCPAKRIASNITLMFSIGVSRPTCTIAKSVTPSSRPSSAKKIPGPSTPAKGEKELEVQVTLLNEQVGLLPPFVDLYCLYAWSHVLDELLQR